MTLEDRIENQKAEFDALERLAVHIKKQPAIVEDDYNEWRHKYQHYMEDFLKKAAKNRPDQFYRIYLEAYFNE